MKNRKKNTKLILLLLLICITLGYAALRTNLNINGTANVSSASWDVHFENYQKDSISNVEPTTSPVIGEKTTTISYEVNLTTPGDIYEFTVDAVNAGTIDAMVESVSTKLNGEEISEENPLPNYLNYSITYSNYFPIQPNHKLAHNTHETYRISVGYKTNINPEDLPQTPQSLSLMVTVNFVKADNNATNVNTGLAYDGHELTFDYIKNNPFFEDDETWYTRFGDITFETIAENSADVKSPIIYYKKDGNYRFYLDIQTAVSIETDAYDGSHRIIIGECPNNPEVILMQNITEPIIGEKMTYNGIPISKLVLDFSKNESLILKYQSCDTSSHNCRLRVASDYLGRYLREENTFCQSLREYLESLSEEELREKIEEPITG